MGGEDLGFHTALQYQLLQIITLLSAGTKAFRTISQLTQGQMNKDGAGEALGSL